MAGRIIVPSYYREDRCGCPTNNSSTDEIAKKIESLNIRLDLIQEYLDKIASAGNLKLDTAPADMGSPSPTKQGGTGPAETKLGSAFTDSATTPGGANEAVTTVGVAPATEDAHSFG